MKEIFDLSKPLRWIHDRENVKFFLENQFESVPLEWKEPLKNCTPTELQQLVNGFTKVSKTNYVHNKLFLERLAAIIERFCP